MSDPSRERTGDLRRIGTSIVVSALGTWSYNVAIAVYAYDQTHSTAWVAAATVGRYIPALAITWFGSRWVARFSRRRVAVAADAGCAVTMLVLTVLAALHGPLVLAIALAALSSGLSRIQSSTALSVAADVVVESQLVRSMALIGSAEAVAVAAGPAIASLVLTFYPPPVLFLLNGITFAVSAILLAGTTALPRTKAVAQAGRPALTAADRALLRSLWPLLTVRATGAFLYGMDVVLLAVIATQQLRNQTTGYGWLLTAAGAGGLLGAVLLRRRHEVAGSTISTTVGMVLYALPLLVFLASPALGIALAAQTVRGIGCVLVTTTVIASLQRAVPSGLSQQVFGQTHTLVLAGTAVGALVAPMSLHVLGLDGTLLLAGLLPLVVQAALFRRLLRFDRGAAELTAAVDPRVSLLRQLTLFHAASRWTLSEIAERAEEQAVAAGASVVSEGEPSDALYVLVSGSVDVTARTAQGVLKLRQLDAPAYFGEIGLIHHVPRTATVTAVDGCVVWRVPADAFLSAVAQAGPSGALSESVRVRLSVTPGLEGDVLTTEL